MWLECAAKVTSHDDNYDVEDVVEKMLVRRDRRIPGSVYKPHADTIFLI